MDVIGSTAGGQEGFQQPPGTHRKAPGTLGKAPRRQKGPSALVDGARATSERPEANEAPPRSASQDAAPFFVLILEGKRWQEVGGKALGRAETGKRAGLKVGKALAKVGHPERAEKLQNCSTWLRFREWLLTGTIKLRDANWCNMTRLCVPCAHAAAVRTMRQYVGRTTQLLSREDWLPVLVTLTVTSGTDLAERFHHLETALQTCRQRRRDCGRGKAWSEFARIQAAAWRFEIKRGSTSGQWHPHVHGLCLVKRGDFFELPRLWSEWSEITGDSSNVDVRLTSAGKIMHKRRVTWGQVTEQESRTLIADHCEVFKYCMKFGDMTAADVVHAWEFLHGRRLSRLWGDYRGLKDEAAAGDDHEEPGAYRDILCHWLGDRYGVVKVETGGQDDAEVPDVGASPFGVFSEAVGL